MARNRGESGLENHVLSCCVVNAPLGGSWSDKNDPLVANKASFNGAYNSFDVTVKDSKKLPNEFTSTSLPFRAAGSVAPMNERVFCH